MGSELAKTLRSMSDDHRMVPDFSEKLLDIADAIERLQKECLRQKLALQEVKTANMELAQLRPSHLIQERDAALAEVERLKGELAEASGQVEWLDKSNNLLRTQIEGFK